MADNKTDEGEWGREVVKGEDKEREKYQKEDRRKQIGILDQFRIPYKRRGQLMANSGREVM
jgi:hypothetical protein